ncbi:glycosyl hydrolase 115 family protein [Clostridium estertheticum]|uniref:glycosyl hydrolase 115 family protein n=1 Tax=Clostridium estertheticum TaxID=238834 RepID=UPI001CF17578|nr:glycosyl hydrolase 115 family protein [Clostridium estertheticum]MCB2339362.1 glycosyl hydrolase 115 family protein [Clostridium estertheticum]
MKQNKFFILNKNTKIEVIGESSKAIRNIINIFLRDINKVFKAESNLNGDERTEIIIRCSLDDTELLLKSEEFTLKFQTDDNKKSVMNINAKDELGIIYALLYISKTYLGVDPFWFWNDKEPKCLPYVRIPMSNYKSFTKKVKYRGWFVNDEVLLSGWRDSPTDEEVWKLVFETILRCGGNMVIPGTDKTSKINKQLASDMGLWITHHHAEPLGAEMFLRAYPGEEPIYDKNNKLFEELWRSAVLDQKDTKVIWNIGFRGQGDQAFWEYDATYKTPEARGKLISKVIQKQYEIVKEYVEKPVFCTNLYGEIMELYKEGYIEIPEGVIKIWADSGYGKMVSRRQGNYNPRIYSLPSKNEIGPHGVYYHVTFYDLQSANHLTMLPNTPQFVKSELETAFMVGANEYLIINSGNIRPHTYMLDLMSELWKYGYLDTNKHMENYMKRYFPSGSEIVQECFNKYFNTPVQYGQHEDERAGEQFYHYPTREIISHWIKDKNNDTIESLNWATGDVCFEKQIKWYKEKCEANLNKWEVLKNQCDNVIMSLLGKEKSLFCDSLLLQVIIHLTGCKGSVYLCKGYDAFREENYSLSFIHVCASMKEYEKALSKMKESEHDKWMNFYRNDCLTNVKLTIYCLDTLRRYIRVLGDGSNFYNWEKQYVLSNEDRNIMLLATTTNQLTDDELYAKIKGKVMTT